jgi:hypothetical protein
LFLGQNSPPVPGKSPRNSSPVHNDGNLSNNFDKLNLNSSSGSTSGIGTQSEKSSSFGSGAREGGHGSSNNNSSGNSSGDLGKAAVSNEGNLRGSEFARAPGCEKKMKGAYHLLYSVLTYIFYKKTPFLSRSGWRMPG